MTGVQTCALPISTNDLDIETLELLEQLVQDYEGTVFIVSHDRAFLDQVVTSTLVFEGEGRWREYEGGVEDWLTQSKRTALWAQAAGASVTKSVPAVPVSAPALASTPAPTDAKATRGVRKLSYKEQRELEGLPAQMEALEQEQQQLRSALADPDIYSRDPMGAARMHERDAAIEEELLQCLERWEELGS